MIPFPQIDPVIFQIGPIAPRWYGLMYLLGFLYTHRLLKKHSKWMGLDDPEKADSVLATLVLSMIVCSRLVYVTVYNWEETMRGPWWEFLAVWHGGLAFHGGLLGTILGSIYAAKRFKMPWLRLVDVLALSTPVGLGLGRCANFINGELWGRVTDVPWAMVFPGAGPLPRHPSQIYQALLEGPLLFLLLRLVWWRKPKVGVVSAAFLLFYAAFRIIAEIFREPDAQLGFLFGGITMGQLLSFSMVAGGSFMLWYVLTRSVPHDSAINVAVQKRKSKR
jgi:phosphatidylglycerol:prolipoprotein diacylglycerol transferase